MNEKLVCCGRCETPYPLGWVHECSAERLVVKPPSATLFLEIEELEEARRWLEDKAHEGEPEDQHSAELLLSALPELIDCPECGGEGWVRREGAHVRGRTPCPDCLGRGRIINPFQKLSR